MDSGEWLPADAVPKGVVLQRETTVNGLIYRVEARASEDQKAEISLLSRDADGVTHSVLSGTLSLRDIALVARVLKPELDALAAWYVRPLTESYERPNADDLRNYFPNHGAAWTPDQERLLAERWQAGATVDQIGRELGRNTNGIRARLSRLGFDVRHRETDHG
jgi:hypothetical protein